MIHPTAIIDPEARVDPSAEVGPYAIIDAGVSVGPRCKVGPHVHLTGQTTIGAGNHFHAGCVIGDAPQDVKYQGEPTRLRIGDNNLFREQVTIHRANSLQEDTVIGSNNFFMVNSHVGHNSQLGDNIILVNGALIGGHVTIMDHAIISGNCLVHQFVRIGPYTMMQGRAGIGKDLPPYCIAAEVNLLCGLNTVGLRRAGMSPETRMELKRLYHHLFRQGKNLSEAVEEAGEQFQSPEAKAMLDFIQASKRGVLTEGGRKRAGRD